MEEKINNQKIFSYVPPLVARLILDSKLKDSDVFFNDNQNNDNKKNNDMKESIKKEKNNIKRKKLKNKNVKKSLDKIDSEFIKPNVFPITNPLPYSLIMCIQLKGFEKLISKLIIKDQENKKEKLYSEYLSIVIPRLLLKISGILTENGGEILKYNDFEFTIVWNFSEAPENKILKYQKFYSKYALISAIEILKKFDDKEILGTRIEISIGLALGETSIIFFGGERKRSEFLILGDAIEKAELCIDNCMGHEIIISKEINDLFKTGQELITRDLAIDLGQKNIFAIVEFEENNLKNFEVYKGMKLNSNNIYMNKSIYDNLSNKIFFLSSILPQGLIKYLDVGEEQNLKEICILTIETIQISMSLDLIDDLTQIQNIIFDIQKATYMTFGSLLYISKTYSGLIIRCVWGIDPGNFIDDTARAISTGILIGGLTNHYDLKIGIGISTGACFTGLINIQGNRKIFTLLGKKVNLSRTLADEALNTIINSDLKYLIYCDKLTMKHSQKWYRHAYVSKINVYFDQENDIYYESKDDFFTGSKTNISNTKSKINGKDTPNENKKFGNSFRRRKSRKKKNLKNKSVDNKETKTDNDEIHKKYEMEPKKNKLIKEIFSPIENDEYFLPNYNDPFPLIRTHLYNSFNPMNKLTTFNLINKITQKHHTLSPSSLHKENMNEYSMKKLKKSQTIFGYSNEIKRIMDIMNLVLKYNRKQFFVIRGPAGVGKTLFVRKALNNFIGLNEKLSTNYFVGDEFLFCNILNPFTATLPYNTISFILRKIYLNILRLKKLRCLIKNIQNLSLDDEDYKHISYILSLGKNDIDIKNEINFINKKEIGNYLKEKEENEKKEFPKKKKISSVMIGLEGPYKYKNINKLNSFFYEMIKIYKEHLNKKNISKNNKSNDNYICPLIFVIDDIQKSNNFSLDFIEFLFNQTDKALNPLIIILVEETPINYNYTSFGVNKKMELFISTYMDYNSEISEDKIISFDIRPINDKVLLQKLIIYYFKEYVLNNFKTNLEIVDDQILDFLLIKSFNGIPLLIISLFKSLMKSDKFVQTLSGEFIITSELIDDNRIFDWSDILLPYVYEKYASMKVNSLLNFKETLIMKYASILGTIFDLQILDKLNPLNSIIKIKDLEKLMLKLSNEYIIEIFYDYNTKSEKSVNIICKICFPLMREVLQQKFPMEYRSMLHMKAAKILSTEIKANYFSTENNILILKRHLLHSEMKVINETEPKEIKTVRDILQNKQVLNYSNLKILLVKELYSKFCFEIIGNILEGNLELLVKSRWLRVSYYIDRRAIIYFNQRDVKNGTLVTILEISIQNIYRNHILKNFDVNKFKCLNVLEISVSSNISTLIKNSKHVCYLRSEQREEICKLDIAINFLKVKVNYDKYVYTYGISKFPLYKYKWFIKKNDKYYANIIENQINKRKNINSNDISNTDRLINESKNYYKPFTIIIRTTLSIFFGIIQENIVNKLKKIKREENDDELNKSQYNYLNYFTMPKHLSKKINLFLKDSELKGIIKIKNDINKPSESDRKTKVSFNQLTNENLNKGFNNPNKSNLKNKYNKFINRSQDNKNSDIYNKNKSFNKTNSKKQLNIKSIPKPKSLNKNENSSLNIPKKIDFVKMNKLNDKLNLDDEISFSDFDSNDNSFIKERKNISMPKKKQLTIDKNSEYNIGTEDSSLPKSFKEIMFNDKFNDNDNRIKSRNIKFNKKRKNLSIDKNSIPGDFVPRTNDNESDKKHVHYIQTETRDNSDYQKEKINIYNFDILSIMSSNKELNKNKEELKYKSLYDDPKYVYVENYKKNKNKKVHKSNLFLNIKSKDK